MIWGYHYFRKPPCHDLWILSLPQPLPSARLSNDGHYALCQASSIVLLHLATLCARSQSGVAEQKHPHQEHQAGTKDFLAKNYMENMLMTCWVRMKRKSRICLLPVPWHEMTSILSIQHSKCLAIEMYSASTLRNIAFIFLCCGQALSGNAISIVPFNRLSLWRLRPQPLNHLFSPTLAPRAVRFAMQEEDGHLQLAWDFSQNHAFMAVYWTWKWNGYIACPFQCFASLHPVLFISDPCLIVMPPAVLRSLRNNSLSASMETPLGHTEWKNCVWRWEAVQSYRSFAKVNFAKANCYYYYSYFHHYIYMYM